MKENDFLKLENQLCFPLYAASRLVTKCYQPLLDEFGLTYPQYLVLLILWETDTVSLKVISEKLYLQSNTLTPLLKRMEDTGLINRTRSQEDERSIIISLTKKGNLLKLEAPKIQDLLKNNLGVTLEEAEQLHGLLYKLIGHLSV
ncbi:MarR family winged helix-turn-helix transcriptional regulator [Pedobacter sp. L105]|uniref:MarR family winged helix-turn-helix transcriptional regulator n=1 Tax=Pedobacter sp. L105 TaxID=1641871 RepID=UPI00131D55E2|nr:MarR family transcriptional regulator [Pedobacter sp. L105]